MISKGVLGGYDVFTNETMYRLEFEYYPINTIHPKREGLCRLYFETEDAAETRRAQLEERAAQLGVPYVLGHYGATYERPGIYHPGWQEPAND